MNSVLTFLLLWKKSTAPKRTHEHRSAETVRSPDRSERTLRFYDALKHRFSFLFFSAEQERLLISFWLTKSIEEKKCVREQFCVILLSLFKHALYFLILHLKIV
jgi:hypothetical protein